MFTVLETTLTPELIQEGYVREVISKIQQLRKQADLEMMDRITVYMDWDEEIKAAVEGEAEHIKEETLADSIQEGKDLPEFDINGHKTGMSIEKN